MEYRGIGISGNRNIVESRNRGIEECENENGEWSNMRIRKGNRAMGEWGNEDSLKWEIFTDKRVRIFQFRTGSCFSGILSHISTQQVQIQLRNLFIVILLHAKLKHIGLAGSWGGSNLDSYSLRSATPCDEESNRPAGFMLTPDYDVFELSFASILIMFYWKGERLYDKYLWQLRKTLICLLIDKSTVSGVFAYLPYFFSQILDLIFRTVLIFLLMYFEWCDTENQRYSN